MPRQIDQEAIDKAKVLDLNAPPTTSIPYQPFPKMVYKHPKDKTQEHKYKVVYNEQELAEALKAGWRKDGHVPVAPPVLDEDLYEGPEETPKGKK